jgi:hypothetical protein
MSQAVAERVSQEPAKVEQHPASDSAALIAVISRAASDPNVDIDKMERLMAMHERMQARTAQVAYDEAFAEMQPNLPEIDKRGKIIIKEKGGERVIQSTPYALWDDTNKLIKPILSQYGFALSFRISQTPDKITTTAVLAHRAGHRETTDFSASIDSTGSKNNVQGWGSSFSYGKRYTGTAILNITTKGEDDDGKAAGAELAINDQQRTELDTLITATKSDAGKFLTFFDIEFLAELPASRFDEAKRLLEAKRK